jgi:hypothetical protein
MLNKIICLLRGHRWVAYKGRTTCLRCGKTNY